MKKVIIAIIMIATLMTTGCDSIREETTITDVFDGQIIYHSVN